MDLTTLIERCETSRKKRQTRYGWYRLWYTRGTDKAGNPARYNKIQAHIELLSSYLYAPESARFAVHVRRNQSEEFADHAGVARDVFQRVWRDSGTDVLFGQLVDWGCIYGATVAKLIPDPHTDVTVQAIHPGDVGVLREDQGSLDRQDVVCHWFALSLFDVARLVKGLPKEAAILAWASENATPGLDSGKYPGLLSEVIATNVSGTFPNQSVQGVTNLGLLGEDRPETEEPLVECVEVWEKRDFTTPKGKKFQDYWVTTMIGNEPVLERRNPVLPWQEGIGNEPWESELPMVSLCPRPYMDYFWGQSEILGLIQLQQWREDTMVNTGRLFDRQLDPPRFFSGLVGIPDEKLKGLGSPGGYAATPSPNAKMDVIQTPNVAEQAYALVDRIDAMFADRGGLPEILSGAQGQMARSGQQVAELANIAVGRIRKQALIIEDAAEVIATRMFHLLQRGDDTLYPLENGKRFRLAELPPTTSVKISAHSASPVYAAQVEQKADRLLKAGAIDLVDYVDLIDPPNREELRVKAKALQQAKAQLVQKRLAIEEKKAENRGRR